MVCAEPVHEGVNVALGHKPNGACVQGSKPSGTGKQFGASESGVAPPMEASTNTSHSSTVACSHTSFSGTIEYTQVPSSSLA